MHNTLSGNIRTIGVLLLAALLAACGSSPGPRILTATPDTASLVPARVALASDAGALPPGTNPLTGLAVDPAVLNRPPLAVKISNAPDSVRPQAGIADADLVFEHRAEAGLTRFTAIFWTHTPPRVGSVRSARLIDLELIAMYGAVFAYSGASEPIRQRIAAAPFAARAYEGVTTGEPLFYRDPGIESPHNLFVIPAEVWARAAAQGIGAPALRGMRFSGTPSAGGTPAQRVSIDCGPDRVVWEYDAATGRYARTADGEPHRDANTGQQVTAANVVLIYAHHQDDLSIVESEWQGVRYFSTEIQIWTLGPAVIIRDGQAVRGYWMRWDENALLTFWADEAATIPLALKPGNTWFEVVPLDFDVITVE